MNEVLDQSHIRMIVSSRLNLSAEEKGILLSYCCHLGQLGPRIYQIYPEDEVTCQEEKTGLYGPLGNPHRVRLALPNDFKAPYVLPRYRKEGPPPRLVFESLLQLAMFLLGHEVTHRDFPINDEDKRENYERFCDENAKMLMRCYGTDAVPLPKEEKQALAIAGMTSSPDLRIIELACSTSPPQS